jgi:2-amino-4-hydroxy-6-hydroxymethyldihydropteridine diphosphokinase
MKILRTTYLSLGTNLGDKLQNLQDAVNEIAITIGDITALSPVYKTKSWGFEAEDFLNIAIKVQTAYAPELLLEKIHFLETKLGRTKLETAQYESRIIDIDILLFDDDIVFSKTLLIPHNKMLERNFVLAPLAAIAANLMHPITKTKIAQCLANCTDETEITKTDLKLIRPIPLEEQYSYIAIEGNIGAGKTTLTNMMAADFNAKKVLERFADNPFLPKFYEDKERYAFPLEMSFLADRYQQLSDDLAQYDLFKNFIISDYYVFKSIIFSKVTLNEDEFKLYRKVFEMMYKEMLKPDLYVFLYQSPERLLENIKSRGRDYEQNISADYLKKIHDGYMDFIKTKKEINTRIIDVSDYDFVKNDADYRKILAEIRGY